MKQDLSGATDAHESAAARPEPAFSEAGEIPDGNHLPDAMSAEQVVEPRFVHPDARALFLKLPLLRHVPMFGKASEAFGPKAAGSLGVVELLAKGIVSTLLSSSRLPMFRRRYGVDAIVYQRFAALWPLGSSLMPLTALLSDTFSVFGYTKRWYMAGACVLGSGTLLGYGLLPAKQSSAPVAAAFIFLSSFSVATVVIMSQGHYSRLIRQVPAQGPFLLGWVWWLIMFGAMVAVAIQGPLINARLEQMAVLIASALFLSMTTAFIFNWYGERRNRENRAEDARLLREALLKKATKNPTAKDPQSLLRSQLPSEAMAAEPIAVLPLSAEDGPALPACCFGAIEVNSEVVRRNWRVALFCVLMTLGVVSLAIVTILGTRWHLIWASVTVGVTLCSFGFFALPLAIAKAALYLYIHNVTYVDIIGALDSFFVAQPDCVPDGPNFSFVFFSTVTNLVCQTASFFAVYLFTHVFSKRTYRLTYILTTTLLIVSGIFDLAIVERWNRPHVSDKVAYLLGDAVLYHLCSMLSEMPGHFLLARLCPRGSESMVFALLAGLMHLGSGMANTIGSLLMEFKWPVESDPAKGCDFSNLKWLLIVGHMLLPLVDIPLAFVLLPAARIDQDLDANGRAV